MSYSYIYSNLAGNIDITPLSGNDCNVTVSGNGSFNTVQTSTGGSSEPAVIIQNNDGGANPVYMQLYKNSSTPAGNDGIGSISFQGNSSTGGKREYARIQADIRDPTNTSENGSISFSAAINNPIPTEFLRIDGSNGQIQMYRQLDTRSNAITNSQSGAISIIQSQNGQNINLLTTGTNCDISNVATGNFTVNSNAFSFSATNSSYLLSGQKIVLTSSSSTIEITQPTSTSTKLTTSLSNINYYPDFVTENSNSSSVSIPLPSIPYQKLTLINKGITPTTTWSDFGVSIGNISVIKYSSYTGYYWIASGPNIYVYDSTLTTLINTSSPLYVSGTSSGSSTRITSIYDSGIYMYIGGDFTTVNDTAGPNATAQYGISRINTTGYSFDPIYNSGNSDRGVNGYINCITEAGGNLYVGGNFSSFYGSGNSVLNYFRIESPGSTQGSQTFTNLGGELDCYGEVFCNFAYGNYVFTGGNFSSINSISPTSYYFIAAYEYAGSPPAWTYVDGNSFNSSVYAISNSVSGYLLVGGNFSHSGHQYTCYINGGSPNDSSLSTTLSSSPISFNGVNNQNGYDLVIDSTTYVWTSTTFQTWADKGLSDNLALGYIPSGVYFWNSYPKASYSNYTYVRENTPVSQSCTFSLTSSNFLYGGAAYTNYTISSAYVAQQFVADSTNTNWIPQGNPVANGSFS